MDDLENYPTLLREVGELDTLRGKPRRHVVTYSDTWAVGEPAGYLLPATVTPHSVKAFAVPIGEAPAAAQQAYVVLGVAQEQDTGEETVWVNGHGLPGSQGYPAIQAASGQPGAHLDDSGTSAAQGAECSGNPGVCRYAGLGRDQDCIIRSRFTLKEGWTMKKPATKKRWVRRIIGYSLLGLLVYMILGATLPFARFPEVSQEFQQSFSTDPFYSDTVGTDRAVLVETSQEALEYS